MEPGVIVRAARESDAEAVALVLTTSLGDKLRSAYGAHTSRVVLALVRHDLARPGERHFVAERDGRVVGAVHLALAQEPDPGFAERVAAEVGWLRAVRAYTVLSSIAHSRLADDEAYIEELGVMPDVRRQGAATALLAACEDAARAAGRGRLTLWVVGGNDPAIALYRGNGFTVRRRRRSLGARLFLGVTSTLLMEKVL